MAIKKIEFSQAHSFKCSCEDLVALRFSKFEHDRWTYVEIWHKSDRRMFGDVDLDLRVVGKNLRVLLQDTRCSAWKWFDGMGYD